ncbi:MAG: ThiF family adenylyltransferase [Anaerolineaceae bacterium]|mgnify:FL=1|nr:ThiF family adenylyltransferase [Anaerolineaceae bacterium]MDD4042440.1 ThiF family adenylyltransferase [Anaerolineaceae bacterium]MDD4577147.1 ThiF family adenylyltransferase [Anaerolineaceae bacterium]
MENNKPTPTVFIPAELEDCDYIGDLYGLQFDSTNIVNVLAWDEDTRLRFTALPLEKVGVILAEGQEIPSSLSGQLVAIRNGNLQFSRGDITYKKDNYNLVQNIFSRNTGILETDYMLGKRAFIIGCGSVGSLIALELARAGVGRFVLVDHDVLNFHNLCRHQCGIAEVGRFKVDAVKDRILAINPMAEVETVVGIVENISKEGFDQYCDQDTIMIGSADNREAGAYANRVATIYDVPFVSIGFWERAFAGEIFYSIPSENMPCYECVIGRGDPNLSAQVSTNRRFYSNQEDLQKVNFEPGISADINFVTIVGIKLILDILNRHNPNYTPRVINYLTQYTLVCNTNDPKIGGDMAEIFSHPLQVTHSIQGRYLDPCPPCKYKRQDS